MTFTLSHRRPDRHENQGPHVPFKEPSPGGPAVGEGAGREVCGAGAGRGGRARRSHPPAANSSLRSSRSMLSPRQPTNSPATPASLSGTGLRLPVKGTATPSALNVKAEPPSTSTCLLGQGVNKAGADPVAALSPKPWSRVERQHQKSSGCRFFSSLY